MNSLNRWIYVLLALSLLTQSLFAIDLRQEIGVVQRVFQPEFSPGDEPTLNFSEMNYSYDGGVSPYWSTQTFESRTQMDGYEVVLQTNHQNFTYESEGTGYSQEAPLNSFSLRAPLFNQVIDIHSVVGWNSYPILGVDVDIIPWGLDFSFIQRQESYEGELTIEEDELEFIWRSLVQLWSMHWGTSWSQLQYDINYQGSRSQPYQLGDVYLAQQEIIAHQWSQEIQWEAWMSVTEWSQKNSKIKLNGAANPSPFAEAPWSMNFVHQSIFYQNWGAHFSSLNLVSPKPLETQTLNPQNFPFEGLQSFWFVQNNDFLRWGGSIDLLTFSLSHQANLNLVEGSHWKVTGGVSQKLGRTYYQIQEVREISTRWLGFIPLSSELRDYNSQVNSLDFYSLGFQLEGSYGSWGASMKVSQIIPLYHTQNSPIDQRWVVDERVEDPGTSDSPSVTQEQSLTDTYRYHWGDALAVELLVLLNL